jgi:hypothetical protein
MVKLFFILLFCISAEASETLRLRGEAVRAMTSKNYVLAAMKWSQMAQQAGTTQEKNQAKYYLGLTLSKLDLVQTAAFPLVEIVRSGPGQYQKKALNHLVVLANKLGEERLLQYSVEKLSPEELTESSKASFYLNLSEVAENNGNLEKAFAWAVKSYEANEKSEETLYQLGSLSLAKKDEKLALTYFTKLYEMYQAKSVVDKRRGVLLMNLARTHYQMKEWDQAATYYRNLPKDHFYYRQSLKELSWTLFRGGKFRSALSPLQSLSTPFYSQFYDPETLLLSGIIHLMSCQNEDVFRIMAEFDKSYIPGIKRMEGWLQENKPDEEYYTELTKAQTALAHLKKTGQVKFDGNLPFFILRTVLDESDIQARIAYLKRLEEEDKKLQKLFSVSGLTTYGSRNIKIQSEQAKKDLAKNVQAHLKIFKSESENIVSQVAFLKYEMLDSKKADLKRQVASGDSVEGRLTRDYYAQNGYRYWPFQGEYWRDEIGSFQYVGQNLCKK